MTVSVDWDVKHQFKQTYKIYFLFAFETNKLYNMQITPRSQANVNDNLMQAITISVDNNGFDNRFCQRQVFQHLNLTLSKICHTLAREMYQTK